MILSARYANSDETAAIIETDDAGSVAVSLYDTPLRWAELFAWGVPTPFVEPESPVLTRIYKADIWRRSTDAEAAIIDTALNSQPVRLRRLWSDAMWLLTTDELFATIQGAFIQAFGAERAGELLEPTE